MKVDTRRVYIPKLSDGCRDRGASSVAMTELNLILRTLEWWGVAAGVLGHSRQPRKKKASRQGRLCFSNSDSTRNAGVEKFHPLGLTSENRFQLSIVPLEGATRKDYTGALPWSADTTALMRNSTMST